MTKVQKSVCDCLKDIFKHTVIWPWNIVQLQTRAHRPQPRCGTFGHSEAMSCSLTSISGTCKLKFPGTVALPYQVTLFYIYICQLPVAESLLGISLKGNPDRVLGSCSRPGPALTVVGIWRVNQQIFKFFFSYFKSVSTEFLYLPFPYICSFFY